MLKRIITSILVSDQPSSTY